MSANSCPEARLHSLLDVPDLLSLLEAPGLKNIIFEQSLRTRKRCADLRRKIRTFPSNLLVDSVRDPRSTLLAISTCRKVNIATNVIFTSELHKNHVCESSRAQVQDPEKSCKADAAPLRSMCVRNEDPGTTIQQLKDATPVYPCTLLDDLLSFVKL